MICTAIRPSAARVAAGTESAGIRRSGHLVFLVHGCRPDVALRDRNLAASSVARAWSVARHLAVNKKVDLPAVDSNQVTSRSPGCRPVPDVVRQRHGTGFSPVAWDRAGLVQR